LIDTLNVNRVLSGSAANKEVVARRSELFRRISGRQLYALVSAALDVAEEHLPDPEAETDDWEGVDSPGPRPGRVGGDADPDAEVGAIAGVFCCAWVKEIICRSSRWPAGSSRGRLPHSSGSSVATPGAGSSPRLISVTVDAAAEGETALRSRPYVVPYCIMSTSISACVADMLY
jgi:hypothetical protein